MALIDVDLELTVLLFEDEVTVWHNYDAYSEEPETTTKLLDLFEGYAEDLKGGFGYVEAETYVQQTLTTLDKCKAMLLNTLKEMKTREEPVHD